MNRIHIGLHVALRVLGGECGLAEHVVGIAKASGLQLASALQSLEMVSPITNCSPIRRMAMSTPLRTSGSPPLAVMRLSAASRPDSLCVSTSFPVTTSPQAAALTKSEGLLPR
jgi:hypothetical protein